MPQRTWQRVVFPIAGVLLTALCGSFFMDARSLWYLSLQKPGILPPAAAFPIIWALMYALIAFSLVLLCMRGRSVDILLAYVINAALQVLWTYLFGQKHLLHSAMWCLLLLAGETYALYRLVHKTDKNIAYLLIPYFLWLLFACALNYALVMLN